MYQTKIYSTALATEVLRPVLDFLTEKNPGKLYFTTSQIYPGAPRCVLEIKEKTLGVFDLMARTVVLLDRNFENGEAETHIETRDFSLISQDTLESLMIGQNLDLPLLEILPHSSRIAEDFWRTIPF